MEQGRNECLPTPARSYTSTVDPGTMKRGARRPVPNLSNAAAKKRKSTKSATRNESASYDIHVSFKLLAIYNVLCVIGVIYIFLNFIAIIYKLILCMNFLELTK